jgi:hypothetical protein
VAVTHLWGQLSSSNKHTRCDSIGCKHSTRVTSDNNLSSMLTATHHLR